MQPVVDAIALGMERRWAPPILIFLVKLSSVNQFLFLIFVMFIFEKKIKCEVIRTVLRKVGVIFIKYNMKVVATVAGCVSLYHSCSTQVERVNLQNNSH